MPYTGMGEEYVNNQEHRDICVKMAEESVVLLKNEKNILPFLPEKTESLAIIGLLRTYGTKTGTAESLPIQ